MSDNVSTIWYFDDWDRDTKNMTFEEKGLWMDIISITYRQPAVGVFIGAFLELEIGDLSKVWPIIKRLGVKKVGDFSVCINEKFVPLTMSHYEDWNGFEPEVFTKLKIVCRKAVKLEAARKKEAERTKRKKQHKEAENQGEPSGEPAENQGEPNGKPTPTGARVLQSSVFSNSPVVPPLSGGTKHRRGKETARVQENTPLMARIGSWFKRRPETLWAKSEADKLADINPQDDEVELLERYYLSDDPQVARYRRHDLVTMLNNWNRELDWAREKLGGGRVAEEVVGAGAERMRGMEVV